MSHTLNEVLSNPAVRSMNEQLGKLSGGLQFKIKTFPSGEWTAESTNISGIVTGGGQDDDMDGMIKDAIFTFFEIPKDYCIGKLLKQVGENEKERGKATYLIDPGVVSLQDISRNEQENL